jgi:hypothetical protein
VGTLVGSNDATRAFDRAFELGAVKDREGLRFLAATTMTWFDHRAGLDLTADVAVWCEALVLADAGHTRTTVEALLGARIAVVRVQTRGLWNRAAFDVDTLNVIEVDGDGHILASVTFDETNRVAAVAEAAKRFAMREGRERLAAGA